MSGDFTLSTDPKLGMWGRTGGLPMYIQHAEQIPCYCALCVSRCGAVASVVDEKFLSLDADPQHPTGQALCLKGKVAPELVYHPDRLLHPLKRTRPKGAADPGWEQISWD